MVTRRIVIIACALSLAIPTAAGARPAPQELTAACIARVHCIGRIAGVGCGHGGREQALAQ